MLLFVSGFWYVSLMVVVFRFLFVEVVLLVVL